MKALHPLALGAAALLVFAEQADAGDRPIGAGQRISTGRPIITGQRNFFSSHSNHFSWEGKHGFHGGKKFHGGFGGVWLVEREVPVIIEREVVREVPAEPPPPPPPPRKPHVIGKSYDSLPEGCMKLIEDGVSYYGCGGEWYKQVGNGRYVAVAARL